MVAVLTWEDLPRVIYSTAGQSAPIPGPLDAFSLDNKVRFVGDRVAFVAAETEEIAYQALHLIDVEYEPLPAVLDPADAMKPGAPVIHDEKEYQNFDKSDPTKNLAAQIHIDIGNVEEGFKKADLIFEGDYEVPKVQQAHIEPHAVITYWDEDDRLVIRTSTQVPFHVRRILAPVLGLPVKRIRVIKPRIGGGFGGKQEVMIEDVAAHLTIATGRPVRLIYTREEEFIAARSRHPDENPHEDRRQKRWHDHGERNAPGHRHRRLWLPCPDCDRQYRPKSDGVVRGRWRVPQITQYPLLCRHRLHQPSAGRRFPRLRRSARLLGSGTAHGKDCPGLEPGLDCFQAQECPAAG